MTVITLKSGKAVGDLLGIGHDARAFLDWIPFRLHAQLTEIKVNGAYPLVFEHALNKAKVP